MKVSLFLLAMLVLVTSQLSAQEAQELGASSAAVLSKKLDSLSSRTQIERYKNTEPQSTLANEETASCNAMIEQLEVEIANQEVMIQSQEMMIEQIMMRLEILEKGHQEKPLSIVLHSSLGGQK